MTEDFFLAMACLKQCECKTKHLFSLEQKQKEIEQDLIIQNNAINKIKDHQQRYDQIRKATQTEGRLNVIRAAVEQTKKQIAIDFHENQNQSSIKKDSKYILRKPGDRPLSIFSFKRLEKSLKKYNYDADTLNCLINEIVFEARFGSLTTCNQSKMPLELDNAINIALKLIREKRWTTPKLFKEYTNSTLEESTLS
jgi:hypothetical protein